MNVKVFFDTNVLIYAIALNDPRSQRAAELLEAGGVVSVQILNEFVSVARRQLKMPWKETRTALEAFRVLCRDVMPLTVETHDAALKIAEVYRYEFYDALVAASALEAKCAILYSEDLQNGQRIEESLIVRNPFTDR